MRAGLFAFIFFVSVASAAADDAFSVQLVREVPGASKEKIFESSNAWIAETFRSAKAVIDHADKDAGLIFGNGAIDIPIGLSILGASARFTFRLKEEIKDGKFRMTFTNVAMLVDGVEKPIESTNRESNEPKVSARFEQLADSLAASIKKNENW